MKRSIILIAIGLIMLTACLNFRAVEFRITFDEGFQQGKIQITFCDIRSSKFSSPLQEKAPTEEPEQQKEHRKSDFMELVKMTQDDQILLDMVSQGIYIKKRGLFVKDNKVNGRYEGIFSKIKFDEGESLTVDENNIILQLKNDENVMKIDTDGTLQRTNDLIMITWPKTNHEIYWKLNMKEDPESYSLIEEYRAWKDNKNHNEKR